MDETYRVSKSDFESLSGYRLICLVVRHARRILPLLAKNEQQEKRVETAASLHNGLHTVEMFCRSGKTSGCALNSYSGESTEISNASKAVCDTVSSLKSKVLRLMKETPNDQEVYEEDVYELYSTAYNIVEKATSSVRDLVSHSAEQDLNRLLVADLKKLQDLEGQDDFVDPTMNGPLGELWLDQIPNWYSKLSSEFELLLDTYTQEIDKRIRNSTVRCNPEEFADKFRRDFESIGYARLPNPCPFLRDLVVSAYDASLQFEEGRPVRFQLKFESPPNSPQVPFTTEYSSKNLVKLAPTIGLGFRHLIVSPTPQGDSLEIRGITDLELCSDWKDDPTRWSLVRTKVLPVTEVDFRLVVLGVGHIGLYFKPGNLLGERDWGDVIFETDAPVEVRPYAQRPSQINQETHNQTSAELRSYHRVV